MRALIIVPEPSAGNSVTCPDCGEPISREGLEFLLRPDEPKDDDGDEVMDVMEEVHEKAREVDAVEELSDRNRADTVEELRLANLAEAQEPAKPKPVTRRRGCVPVDRFPAVALAPLP